MEAFTVIGPVYGEKGDFKELRTGFFSVGRAEPLPIYAKSFASAQAAGSPVYYNALAVAGELPDPLDIRFEDIPIDELGEKLGSCNVAYLHDDEAFPAAFIPIPVNCTDTADVKTGTIKVYLCSALSHIHRDDLDGTTAADSVFQLIGEKDIYEKPEGSPELICGEDGFEEPDGSPELIEGFVPGSTAYTVTADRIVTRTTPDKAAALIGANGTRCGTMLPDLGLPEARTYVKLTAREKYKALFKRVILSYTLCNLSHCLRQRPDGYDRLYDVEFAELPQNDYMVFKETFPPVNIRIPENGTPNKCKKLSFIGTTVEPVIVSTDRQDFTVTSRYSYDPYSFPDKYHYPYVYLSESRICPPVPWSGNSALELVKLPNVAAEGFIIIVESINELILPEECSGPMVLKLARSPFETFDSGRFGQTRQYIDLGSNEKLTDVTVGGKGRCLFAGRDLKSLKNVTVHSGNMKHLDLYLEGLASGEVNIEIDGAFSGTSPAAGLPLRYPDGLYGDTDINIYVRADKPTKLRIRQPASAGISVIKSSDSAEVNLRITS